MDKFLDGFCFGAIDPPNAAVMLREGENESDVVVAELTSPQFDETNSTLTYTAKVLDDYTFNSDWSHIISKADDAIPEAFGNVSIVIDDCPDSFVGCDKSWDEGCGRIKTGCCWHTWGMRYTKFMYGIICWPKALCVRANCKKKRRGLFQRSPKRKCIGRLKLD